MASFPRRSPRAARGLQGTFARTRLNALSTVHPAYGFGRPQLSSGRARNDSRASPATQASRRCSRCGRNGRRRSRMREHERHVPSVSLCAVYPCFPRPGNDLAYSGVSYEFPRREVARTWWGPVGEIRERPHSKAGLSAARPGSRTLQSMKGKRGSDAKRL